MRDSHDDFENATLSESLETRGVVVLRAICDRPALSSWLAKADRVYRQIAVAVKQGEPLRMSEELPHVKSYRPTASSMLLESIASAPAVLDTLKPLAAALRTIFGGDVVCNLDQAWLRRQYPPSRAPRGHHPHRWHQDGALGFDFAQEAADKNDAALLPMLTAWIPLTECGEGAPGLEYVAQHVDRVVAATDLCDERIRGKFPADCFHAPRLQPGDAVLLWGDVLHRTQVTPTMTDVRTSVEFRFLHANRIPARIANDRYLSLP